MIRVFGVHVRPSANEQVQLLCPIHDTAVRSSDATGHAQAKTPAGILPGNLSRGSGPGSLGGADPTRRHCLYLHYPQSLYREDDTGGDSDLEDDLRDVLRHPQAQILIDLTGHDNRIARLHTTAHETAEGPGVRLSVPEQ